MIELRDVTARATPVALGPVTLTIAPGLTAVLGTPEDGTSLLLAVLAARDEPRAGVLTWMGRPSSAARSSIGFVPLEAELPPGLTVGETLRLGAELRGGAEPTPLDRLGALGIEALASRRNDGLRPDEVRAVLAAEALTSRHVQVVVLEEPLARIDARATSRLVTRLQERAREGAIVVVSTASARDARRLGARQLHLQRGALVASPPPPRTWFRVRASDPRMLAAELAGAGFEVARQGPDLLVTGDAAELGAAVLRAGVDLALLREEPRP